MTARGERAKEKERERETDKQTDMQCKTEGMEMKQREEM